MIKTSLKLIAGFSLGVDWFPIVVHDLDKMITVYHKGGVEIYKIVTSEKNRSDGDDPFSNIWGQLYTPVRTPQQRELFCYWIPLKSGMMYTTNNTNIARHIWENRGVMKAANDFETMMALAFF